MLKSNDWGITFIFVAKALVIKSYLNMQFTSN